MTDDEDVITLYHDIIHVLARLDFMSNDVLTRISVRLTKTGQETSDRIDQRALGTMAAVVVSYIDEDEEASKPIDYMTCPLQVLGDEMRRLHRGEVSDKVLAQRMTLNKALEARHIEIARAAEAKLKKQ